MYKSKRFLTDEQAVSAVIGTILMIAATVVLGGVIYAAVNGFGQKESQSAPDTIWKAQAFSTTSGGANNAIRIQYMSGPDLAPNSANFKVQLTDGSFVPGDPTAALNATAWGAGDFKTVSGATGATYIVTIIVLDRVVLDHKVTL